MRDTVKKGIIEAELYADKAPVTVANFLRYVDGKHFDGGRFHRAVTLGNQPKDKVKIEVIQASINTSRNKDQFPAIKLERTNETKVPHKNGTLSMARGGPDSAKASFSICIGDQPELDFNGKRNADGQGFAAFGQVTKGMDVAKKIQTSPTKAPPANKQTLEPPIKIIKIERAK